MNDLIKWASRWYLVFPLYSAQLCYQCIIVLIRNFQKATRMHNSLFIRAYSNHFGLYCWEEVFVDSSVYMLITPPSLQSSTVPFSGCFAIIHISTVP